jgi:hypothetical protein
MSIIISSIAFMLIGFYLSNAQGSNSPANPKAFSASQPAGYSIGASGSAEPQKQMSRLEVEVEVEVEVEKVIEEVEA